MGSMKESLLAAMTVVTLVELTAYPRVVGRGRLMECMLGRIEVEKRVGLLVG
jgi:hypothetical protein